MDHRLFSYKNSQVSYYLFGAGSRQVVCFHGYGEEARLYSFLEKYAGSQFTFYSIDLPFHGKTKWNEGLNFLQNDLCQIIENILPENNGGPETRNKKFILLGFSLGGRVALSLYQAHPENIEKLILLAPDGLTVNSWYRFATQTWIGNNLFAFSMKYPGWFFAFLKAMNKSGLLNASVFKFVNYYIGKKDDRRVLYQRWTSLRKLKPNLRRIKNLIRQHKTPTRLVYGRYDRIILPVRGEKFQKGIEDFCIVTIIESGHQVVHENHAEVIVIALQN